MVPTWFKSGDSGKEVPSPHCLSPGVAGSVKVPEEKDHCPAHSTSKQADKPSMKTKAQTTVVCNSPKQ